MSDENTVMDDVESMPSMEEETQDEGTNETTPPKETKPKAAKKAVKKSVKKPEEKPSKPEKKKQDKPKALSKPKKEKTKPAKKPKAKKESDGKTHNFKDQPWWKQDKLKVFKAVAFFKNGGSIEQIAKKAGLDIPTTYHYIYHGRTDAGGWCEKKWESSPEGRMLVVKLTAKGKSMNADKLHKEAYDAKFNK